MCLSEPYPGTVGPERPKLTALFFPSERKVAFSANLKSKPGLLLDITPTIFTTTLPNWPPGQHNAFRRAQAALLLLPPIPHLKEA